MNDNTIPLVGCEVRQVLPTAWIAPGAAANSVSWSVRLTQERDEARERVRVLEDAIASMDHARDCRGPWGTCNCARAALSPTEEPPTPEASR